MQDPRDRELGMYRKITRRDFLNGVALTAGAAALPPELLGWQGEDVPQDSAGYYPPALTGLRGSHPGSFEVAHSVREVVSGMALESLSIRARSMTWW